MARVAVVTDSNSGITQAGGAELGVTVIPMPFTIDGVEFLEDINLSQEEFYEKLINHCEIKTSQPSPESVMKYWDKALEDADELVYIPMSSGLSGSCQTARMLAEDYDGKVEVVDNQRISSTMRQSVLDALLLASKGMNAAQIRKALEDDKYNSSIYLTVETLEYLKNGGRITPAVAMIGQLLKIKPVLQIQGEKLDAYSQVRTATKAKEVMLNAIEKDIVERFGGTKTGKGVTLHFAHTKNEEAMMSLLEDAKKRFPDADGFYTSPLSLSVSCHIGPGLFAVLCTKNSFANM